MHKHAAVLRHRELTQELYNIGDEVAEYIEHLIEAIEDWDQELTLDCLSELAEIVEDARVDSGRIVGELIGLRHALVSGVRAGSISASVSGDFELEPPRAITARTLELRFPLEGPQAISEVAHVLRSRTECVQAYLREMVDYVLEQTNAVARNLDMISLPHLYKRAGTGVRDAASAWVQTVAASHPAYARTLRGGNPPAFLEERARVNAIVEKVAAKRAAARKATGTA
ncbi:hypothetical protein CPHO_03475 [Corynebacterium phocae]|uniref:Uncharacterized protein n=1 Tax=Corynebacterium phocae TaxID=161895 RepID=A0A1L7D213_9CORY|nr:hypothetical protein [Corynebacterium phocae]APT92107.1 hypothetical protein CPHO_03475 [Corynebacterium phocae]KAA8726493.1 hypothetical protein F4V58_03030 [Corynebacterium phocae]